MTESILDQLRRVLVAIEQTLDRPMPLEELARVAGFSTWHFQRVFTALVDEPVASYTRRRRLTEAARTLRADPTRRVLDIALAAGFESHEAFTRAFRRESGHTPSGFRDHPQPNCSWMRLPLAPEHLKLLPTNMNLEPTLVDLPAFAVVGLSNRFIAAMAPDATNMQVIPPLWVALGQRRAEVLAAGRAPQPNESWGLCRCLPPDDRSRDDEMEYLAGVRIDGPVAMPEGFSRWEVPATRYARFTHRGPVTTFGETLGYVFGSWFPRSDFEPSFAMEAELYDDRFKLNEEDSELDYYVAIRPRG